MEDVVMLDILIRKKLLGFKLSTDQKGLMRCLGWAKLRKDFLDKNNG